MKNSPRYTFGNQLERIRISKDLLPQQVADMLGFKNTGPLTQFEKGVRTPNLKVALKLADIYNVPIQVMLDEYYEACLDEVRAEATKVGRKLHHSNLFSYCGFEQALTSVEISPANLTSIRRHASDLIRKTAEKIGHL